MGTFEIDIEIGRDAHEVFVVPAIAQPSPAGPQTGGIAHDRAARAT
jgi:hypothetical protein